VAERLAAERQVSVNNDNNDTDFGEVGSAENAASELFNSLRADNHSYVNPSLLNGDINYNCTDRIYCRQTYFDEITKG
jgi:hypothetical protein